ncbi:ribonuclease-domain-containing protein [Periconia macrospinosa]|uniref:ribonuclease T1 n=1 Tax=Periconia macrospinosa TaxID=97972 RepID=A0A2V1DAE2_9PLEO|nr:ribonuclease-domain-containing protein [Periconia macrospinosa]
MKFLSSLLFLVASTSTTFALPTTVVTETGVIENKIAIVDRQANVVCGSNSYTSSQLTAARNSAANYLKQGGTAGGSSYPHVYNNYEGFDFLISGTYYEFPLLKSGVYTGGSPGADRVVINRSGQRAGEITHTGASGNNFVACSGW